MTVLNVNVVDQTAIYRKACTSTDKERSGIRKVWRKERRTGSHKLRRRAWRTEWRMRSKESGCRNKEQRMRRKESGRRNKERRIRTRTMANSDSQMKRADNKLGSTWLLWSHL